MHGQGDLPQADRDRPLHAAISDLARSLRPEGPGDAIDPWDTYDESLRRLVQWAERAGVFYEGLQPLTGGGREHDLTHDSATQTWLKFTKPSCAGYLVDFDADPPGLEPGLPLEYLERLELQNEIFQDTITFVGVGGTRREPRIITRQRDIVGEPATLEEITRLMVDTLGFRQLPRHMAIGYSDSLSLHTRTSLSSISTPRTCFETPWGASFSSTASRRAWTVKQGRC